MNNVNIPLFKCGEPYRDISKYLVRVNDEEQTDILRCQREAATKAYVVGKRGSIPTMIIEREELIIPSFQIATSVRAKDEIIKQQEANFMSLTITNLCEDSIARTKDQEVFRCLSAAAPKNHIIEYYGSKPSEDDFLEAFGLIKSHDIPLGFIVVNPLMFCRMWGMPKFVKEFDLSWVSDVKQFLNDNAKESLKMDVKGSLHNIPILTSSMMPKGMVMVTGRLDYVGMMIAEPINQTQVRDNEKLREGFVLSSTMGIGIVNDYTVVKMIPAHLSASDKQVEFSETLPVNIENTQ